MQALAFAIQINSSSYHELARIADSIISVSLAVGPISRLLTRQMYLAIESRSAWDHTFRFPPALLEELKFWFNYIESFSVYSIRPLRDSSTVVFSDASDVAFGGLRRVIRLPRRLCGQRSTIDDLNQSFSRSEAIYYVLLCFVEHL